MAAIITNQGAELIAKQQAKGAPLVIKNFVFAHLEGLDTTTPPHENEAMPSADKIMYSQAITKAGYVNPAQVVYSVIVGSDVGDWEYNWLGLEADDGTLFAVAYIPTQQKVKNAPPQMGNTITRNFLISFDGAKSITEITVPAEAWQFDITDKLDDMDERTRLAMRGIFGRATFFNDAFKVVKSGSLTQLSKGVVYVEGIRIELTGAQTITPVASNAIYLDVSLQKIDNIKQPIVNTAFGDYSDYTDNTGVKHYLIKIADSTLSDTRSRIINADSLIEAIDDDPNGDPTHIASLAALQRLKEDLITNSNDLVGSVINLTKEQRGFINLDASTANTVVTLPAATAENKGVEYTIRRLDNTDHLLKIVANTSDKILFHLNILPEGFDFFELIGQGDYWSIYCDGAGHWFVTGRYDASPIGVLLPYMGAVLPTGGYFPAYRQGFDIARFPWLFGFANQSQMLTDISNKDNPEYMGFWVVDIDNLKIYSPNVGGEFIRALDMGQGLDSGRLPGTIQGDAIRNIKGSMTIDYAHLVNATEPFELTNHLSASVATGGTQLKGWRSVNFDASKVVPTAAENRPCNIAYPYLFKAI